jgi:hypothetical protein
MGDRRGAHTVLERNLMKRDQWDHRDVDGRIILKWMFKKWDGEVWTGSLRFRIGTGGGCL